MMRIAIEISNIGIAVDIIPTPRPAIIVVAGPVSDCLTIERTGDFPVAVCIQLFFQRKDQQLILKLLP